MIYKAWYVVIYLKTLPLYLHPPFIFKVPLGIYLSPPAKAHMFEKHPLKATPSKK